MGVTATGPLLSLGGNMGQSAVSVRACMGVTAEVSQRKAEAMESLMMNTRTMPSPLAIGGGNAKSHSTGTGEELRGVVGSPCKSLYCITLISTDKEHKKIINNITTV